MYYRWLKLFVVIIVIIILGKITSIYFLRGKKEQLNGETVLYEGKPLWHPAVKKISQDHNNGPADCNSNLIECKEDVDCEKGCLAFDYHQSKCFTGLCHYIKRDSKTFCQNGGQITSTFFLGRLATACNCPEDYIGLFCQIRNEMNSSYSRTFKLFY